MHCLLFQYGFNLVFAHTQAINCIALSLNHKSMRSVTVATVSLCPTAEAECALMTHSSRAHSFVVLYCKRTHSCIIYCTRAHSFVILYCSGAH